MLQCQHFHHINNIITCLTYKLIEYHLMSYWYAYVCRTINMINSAQNIFLFTLKYCLYNLFTLIRNFMAVVMHNVLSFLSAVSIDNRDRGGGWDGQWGGVGRGGMGSVGGGKKHWLGHPMSSHSTDTVASGTIVGHIISGSKPRTPLPNWCPPWVPLFKQWVWRVGKMPFTKADQLTFNTW